MYSSVNLHDVLWDKGYHCTYFTDNGKGPNKSLFFKLFIKITLATGSGFHASQNSIALTLCFFHFSNFQKSQRIAESTLIKFSLRFTSEYHFPTFILLFFLKYPYMYVYVKMSTCAYIIMKNKL